MTSAARTPLTAFRDRARVADMKGVETLVQATGYFSDEEVEIAGELVAERLSRGAKSGYEFLFADDGERLAGYACFGLVPCSTVTWDLYWIAVHPDLQGAGLGRRLLAETEDRVRRAGGHALFAETSGRDQYVSTRAFYLNNGYEAAAVFEDFYAPGDAKWVFRKILDG